MQVGLFCDTAADASNASLDDFSGTDLSIEWAPLKIELPASKKSRAGSGMRVRIITIVVFYVFFTLQSNRTAYSNDSL